MGRSMVAAFAITLLAFIFSAACAATAPAPTPTTIASPTPTPVPTPTPTPVPTFTVNMDVSVGTPPPEGWKWVVAERNTGTDEVTEATEAHGFFWIFFVINGATAVSTADGTKVTSAGEGIMVTARQQHSHRFLPQSKVLIFDVRSANDNPDRFHGGTKVLVSDKLDVKASQDSKVRVRTFNLSPGSRTPEDTTNNANFLYVIEGTLTTSIGNSISRTEGGKTFTLPLGGRFVMSNDSTMPLRFLLADINP